MTDQDDPILRRLSGVEEKQAQMLSMLGSIKAERDSGASVGGSSDKQLQLPLDSETEKQLESLLSEISSTLRRKRSAKEQKALLEALSGTLAEHQPGGTKKRSYHIDPVTLEKSIVLASYSPAEVVHRFATQAVPQQLTEPERDDFVAAVGFVDVSGFTKLSEKLAAEHGRTGAEMLNVYVNAYFAKLIDGINKFAGDVIKFAGDALQVIWRNRPDGIQDSAATLMLRSAACCLYLLQNLNGFKPAEGVSLTLHMGVGVGPMSGFYVGGCGNKWEYFVAGEPIEQMSDAAEEATSGQLVISAPALAAYLADREVQDKYDLGGHKLASGQYLLETIQIAGGGSALDLLVKRSLLDGMRDSLTARGHELEPFLRCFVPALVEERLDAGQSGAALHEHRKLISVFMKVLGLGPKPCDVNSLEVVQQATFSVQKAIDKYDGTITRLITDDKGTRFLIAFGLPGHQHDNDEERAVLSSLEVVTALDSIPAWAEGEEGSQGSLQCAVGITTGLVFCGEAGWVRNRVEYTLAGAKVNLAARLMQASSKRIAATSSEHGIVLCEKETYDAALSCGCNWQTLEPITVKGKVEPVPIFLPTQLSTAALRRSRSKGGSAFGRYLPSGPHRQRTGGDSTMERIKEKLALFGWRNALRTYGRKDEKKKLERVLLDIVMAGKGSQMVIRGEAGMGKTHFLEEIKAIKACIQVDGTVGTRSRFTPTACAVTTTSNEIERKTPFFMWKDVFERCLSPEFLTELATRTAVFTPSSEGAAAAAAAAEAAKRPTPRRRWQQAIATTISYLYPPGTVQLAAQGRPLAVECVIRPRADQLLLADQLVLQHAPLLSPVLPEPIKDNQWTKQLSGEARKEATLHVMCHVLECKLGGARTTLMFDDVHWMDSGSWALLHAARSRVSPLLIVLTARPMAETDPAQQEIEKFKDQASLSELGRADIDELMRNQLGVTGRVDVALSSAITKRSGGNPYFAKGFVTSFVEQGVLDISHDTVDLVEGIKIADVEFPSSVETLITSRIDRLPVADQMLLKVAAVVACSGSFTEEQLPSMLKAGGLELPPGTTIRSVLRSLRDADMLSFDGAHSKPGNAAFGFKHASVQAVACHVLSQELKQKLHQAAAQDCEALYEFEVAEEGEASGELLRLLAHHWRRAGSDEQCSAKAAKFLRMSGDRAMAECLTLEASEHFTEALEIASTVKGLNHEMGPLHRRLGECYVQQGNYPQAGKSLDKALIYLGGEETPLSQLPEKDVRARLDTLRSAQFRTQAVEAVAMPLKRLSSLFLGQPEPVEPEVSMQQMAVGAPPSEGEALKHMELALAFELMSRVTMQDHDVPLASYCATRALQLGQQLEHLTPVVARAYASLCLTSAADKRQKEALRFKDLALSSCKVLGEQGLLSATLCVAAVNEAGQGSWLSAVSNLNEAISISKEIGDKWQWEESTSHMAHLEYYRGHFGASRLLYEQACHSAEIRRDKKMINRCQAGIASVMLATGDIDGALKILKQTNSYGPTALALLRGGELGEAYSMALKVKDRFKGRRTKYYVLKSFVAVCDVFLQLYENSVRARDMTRSPSGGRGMTMANMLAPHRHRTSAGEGALDNEQYEDPDTLHAMCQEWIDKLTQFSGVYALANPRMQLCRGRLKLISGNAGEGLKLMRRSRELAAKMSMPYDEALALALLSKHTKSSVRESAQLSQEAQEIFTRLGVADPGL